MYNKYIIIIFIILLTVNYIIESTTICEDIIYNYFQNNNTQPKYNNSKNITILLTCTVIIDNNINNLKLKTKNKRLEIYLKSIKEWLYNTNFKIVVVDNSNYKFDELSDLKNIYKDKFEIISFDEKKIISFDNIINSNSKGDHELLAINYANQNSKLINNSDFIIKITGRYFIPGFEKFINSINLYDYDYIKQFNFINCEILGSSRKKFNNLFYIQNKKENEYIELEYLKRVMLDDINKVIIMPIFKIAPTLQGGSGMYKKYL